MHEIISDIYHAAAGTKSWAVVLTRITRDLDLLGCQMIGVSTVRGAVLFSFASDDAPSGIELEYIRKYHALDPRVPMVLGRETGEWVYDQDVFDLEILTTSSYYADLLIPYGGQYSASVKLVGGDDETVFLACMSKYGDVGFTSHHRQYIEALAFHLREGAGLYQRTRRLTTSAMAGTEMLHRIPRPAMLLGPDRTMHFMNEAAKRFIDGAGILFLAGDRLAALHGASDNELAITFQSIGEDIKSELVLGGLPKRRTLRLGRRQGPAAAVLSLTPFAPTQSMYAFGTKPLVLTQVHVPRAQTAPDILLWEAAFNLTPAQARVGLALYQGKTIAQAAAELQIAQTTFKSHLKELFGKTETTGQVQLVAVLGTLQG